MKPCYLGIAAVVVLLAAGCQQKQQAQPATHTETAEQPLAKLDTPPAAVDPYATDPYANDSLTQPRDVGVVGAPKGETKLIAGKEPVAQRTHVVQKGDTLYSLARKYYNDASKWKKIWEANRAQVPDKDKLQVGQKLVIP